MDVTAFLPALIIFIPCDFFFPQGDDVRRGERTLNEPADDAQYTDYGGAVFTRWGRKVCPEKDQLVYAGI